ncbi:hypothetical protein C8J57DRAFT_1073709, partial [Mycena rebaudengoi]
IQDTEHGRKTFRNNTSSGAKGMVLANFLVYFEQVYTISMKPNSPMYGRDWKRRDRMDDRATASLFSADTLEQAAEDPENSMNLVVYLLVFGNLIDAYQSRTISHHERAKMVILSSSAGGRATIDKGISCGTRWSTSTSGARSEIGQ